MKKNLIVLVGPTAVGKTALSIKLAKMYNTEILSADSRQFYKEIKIGTAKPTAEELQEVPHHFINSLSIFDKYDVGQYETDALNLLEELFRKKDKLILTGGSGLFVDAICSGIDNMPVINPGLREELNTSFKNSGPQPLIDLLAEKDPQYYAFVDKANPQRVIRALEVIISTGKPFSIFRKKIQIERPFNMIKIGLNLERSVLYARIDLRMDNMIADGLFEEAAELFQYKELNALQTVGYSEIFGFMEGHYDKEEAIRLLKRNSRRYAKRQLTWFNKDKTIKWFHPEQERELVDYINEELK
jgi:tRNA dimethylallyltransferase